MPEGYPLRCPNCNSLNTNYSFRMDARWAWRCEDCGLDTAPDSDWQPNLYRDD